jgi:hypothetical protein
VHVVASTRVADDFATFRAAYPSVSAALDACTRPDWLVLLAWEAFDHKTAVDLGVSVARLLAKRSSDILWLWKPNPGRLEAVDAWTDKVPFYARSYNFGRAVALAGIPAVGLVWILARFVLGGLWTEFRALQYIALMLALEVVFAWLVHVALARIVRRRAAQLDDRAALAIVLDEIRQGSADNPKGIPIVMKFVSGRVHRLLEGESK